MRVIVNGDTSNPSVISYGHGNRTRYHGIEIGRWVSALSLLHCDSPQEVVCRLTDLATLQVNEIHSNAFAGSSVSSVFIPDTVARVGEAAFSRCFRLQGVVCHAQVLERECFKCCYESL